MKVYLGHSLLIQALQTLANDKVHFRVLHDYTSTLLNITNRPWTVEEIFVTCVLGVHKLFRYLGIILQISVAT